MYVTCLCTIFSQLTVTGISLLLLSMMKFSNLKGGGGGGGGGGGEHEFK